MKEKEKLFQDHEDLKFRLDHEYDKYAESKRGFQQDLEMLMALNSRIKEYTDFIFLVAAVPANVLLFALTTVI